MLYRLLADAVDVGPILPLAGRGFNARPCGAVQRGRGLVELCRMLSRLRRGFNVGINVVLSAGRYIEGLIVQQITAV